MRAKNILSIFMQVFVCFCMIAVLFSGNGSAALAPFIGGFLGALLTGVFVNPALGGIGIPDYLAADTSSKVSGYAFGAQMSAQIYPVLTAIVLSGVVSYLALTISKATTGLRVSEQEERQGLDIATHGERAYSQA